MQKLCPWKIRERFNQLQIAERELQGKLRLVIVDDDDPAPQANQDSGTRSQFVEYWTHQGTLLAKCHRYVRPDGSIGGRGRADPKWLRVGSEIWKPSHDDQSRCQDCQP